jgi:NADH:ubiquinone oxidoreductase subunit F (NADH-binding)
MGSQKLTEIITEIMQRRYPRDGLPVIGELSDTMGVTSICGLGQVAANPIATVLKYFREDLERYFQ